MDPHVEREGRRPMEPDDFRTGPESGSDHDPATGGIRRPGSLLLVLVTLTLVVTLALIAVGAIRLWQS